MNSEQLKIGIKNVRKKHDMIYKKIADEIGMSEQNLSLFLNKSNTISYDTGKKIEEFLKKYGEL